MTTFVIFGDLLRRMSSLRRNQDGIAAVEFAMLAPMMIALYLGVVEITQGISIQRKVTLTARTVADLASQVTSINNSEMGNLLNATTAVLAPFSTSQLSVRLTAVSIDAGGVATVTWSDALNGTQRAVNSTVTVPSALNVANTQVIWSEVTYSYTPALGGAIAGTLSLFDQLYMRPRLSDTVARTT